MPVVLFSSQDPDSGWKLRWVLSVLTVVGLLTGLLVAVL